MTPTIEMIESAIQQTGADFFLFGLIVLLLFALNLLSLMFFLLAVRGLFRWLTRGSWNNVIRSAEKKALR